MATPIIAFSGQSLGPSLLAAAQRAAQVQQAALEQAQRLREAQAPAGPVPAAPGLPQPQQRA